MAITAGDIAKLRASTGAGMMDCKKALEEALGDAEKAMEILRKKGILKAAKRADKIAAEGTTLVKTSGNNAVVLEMNSETDFVAKNDSFKKIVEDIADHILSVKPASTEELLTQTLVSGQGTVGENITNISGTIGEKISLRRFSLLEKTANDAFGAYVHMGGKISVLVVLSGVKDEDLARDVAMHVAASNPKYIRREEVPTEVLEKEKEIYSEQLKQQGKPANIIENILKGKIDKFYGEVCLLEQPFIKDEEQKVGRYIESKTPGAKVEKVVRFELGEGMEKKSCDFAAEVAEQMK
jgi:elongation factor Ts